MSGARFELATMASPSWCKVIAGIPRLIAQTYERHILTRLNYPDMVKKETGAFYKAF